MASAAGAARFTRAVFFGNKFAVCVARVAEAALACGCQNPVTADLQGNPARLSPRAASGDMGEDPLRRVAVVPVLDVGRTQTRLASSSASDQLSSGATTQLDSHPKGGEASDHNAAACIDVPVCHRGS
jgi:hypothetical protein